MAQREDGLDPAGQVEALPVGEPHIDRGGPVRGRDLAHLRSLGQRLGQDEARQHGFVDSVCLIGAGEHLVGLVL